MLQHKVPINQFHRPWVKGQAKKRCSADSAAFSQRLHMETTVHPLAHKLSSVGICLCIKRQNKKDIEGGTFGCQMSLHQGTWGPCGLRKWKASLEDNKPESERDHTIWSWEARIRMVIWAIEAAKAGWCSARVGRIDQLLLIINSLTVAWRFCCKYEGICNWLAIGLESQLSFQKLICLPSPSCQEILSITVEKHLFKVGQMDEHI